MLRNSKIILLLYTIAIAGLVFYAYPIIKSRYFVPQEEKGADIKAENKKNEASPAPTNKNTGTTEEPKEKKEGEKNSTKKNEEEKFLDINKADCDNNCKKYNSDKDELAYCQNFCGLTPTKKTSSNDCGNLEDLEKDYCLKDLAVSKKDFKICDQIEDSGIQKSCQNRVTEEVLNGQSN